MRAGREMSVWDGKGRLTEFHKVTQLLGFSVNWAELCPVI